MSGIAAPVVTPYNKDGSVNYKEFEKVNTFVTSNGVHGVFVSGTTGEFVNLTIEERKQLLISAKKSVVNGAKVMFNTTAMNLKDISELCGHAQREGADAVSFTTPYYHKYDKSALIDYFKICCEKAGDLPVYLYNMSGMTGNPITAELLNEVIKTCPNVTGIKDSSMNFMTILEYQDILDDPDFEIITGNDAQVLASLQAGASGGLIAISGIFPELCVKIWDEFQKGNIKEADLAQRKILKIRELCRGVMPVVSHKAILSLRGFDTGLARFPMRNLNEKELNRIKDTVTKLDLL